MNIVLTGYRCTGKTSAGRLLSARLGRPFYDTDEMVRQRTGQTVEQIVAEGGWEAFRDAELAVIRELSRSDGGVIATGGGALLDPRNVALLRERGLFIWLTADPKTIAARLENDREGASGRPSLSGNPAADEVRRILADREPVYRGIADMTIDTASQDAESVANEICRRLPGQTPGAHTTARQKED